MNDVRLSSTTEKLFAAAKADVPTSAARAKMWAGVSTAVGGAAVGSGLTAGALLSGGASATKLLSIGALFGGTLTVGLAATLLYVGPAPKPLAPPLANDPAAAGARVVVSSPARPVAPAADAPPAVVRPEIAPAPLAFGAAKALVQPKHTRAPARGASTHEDSLAREAWLVTQARGALDRGDPRAALRAIRAARGLPAHQLDPEELAVEEQALRALGQSDEANGIEVQLRL
ncbi:MAG TPA: hypothetical protein VE987_22295 [Polyangiaceae bacterium]|nr:hypothetical protein [Polyangiaceae bacterium]